MKKMKQLALVLCIAALLLSFAGCAPATTEDVLTKLDEVIAGRELTAATVSLDLAMTAEINGESEDITIHINADTMTASETDSYAECEYAFGIGTQKLRDGSQVYNTAENGKLITFTHVDSTDEWSRTETDIPASLLSETEDPAPSQAPEADPSISPAPSGADAAEPAAAADAAEESDPSAFLSEFAFLTLEEETQVLSNLEVYVLSGTLSGDDWKDLMLKSANLEALTKDLRASAPEGVDLSGFDFTQMDFSDLTANVTMYVDKESYQLEQVDMTLDGMDSLINSVFAMLPEEVTSTLGVSVSMEPMQAVFTNLSFDPVTLPVVSEEGRIKGTQASFNPDRGEGIYIIQESGNAVKFTAQSNWTAVDLGYYYASFATEDGMQTADFEMYLDTTPEDFIKLIEDNIVPALQAQGLTVTNGAGSAIGDYQTYAISAPGINIYLAYRYAGDALLGVYVVDANGTDLTTTMTPILNTIEDYQLQF